MEEIVRRECRRGLVACRLVNEDAWVPYGAVRLLVERGRLDVLRAEAGKGDWECGEALGDELVRRGEVDAALDVYRAFVQPDRWNGASDKMLAILETARGVEEAIAFVRPYADAGDRYAVHCLACLLGRHGRVDEMFALLRPRLDDSWMAQALVEATAGQGRDQDVIAELEALVAAVQRHPDEWPTGPSNAAGLLATVLERQGRLDEEIALLRGLRQMSINQQEQLADLLGRTGRESELRELVAEKGREYAAYGLAKVRERQNRLAEAVAVLRTFADKGSTNAAFRLASLLHRHGRVDEAVDVLLAAIRSEAATHGCTREALWTMLTEEGRLLDALGYLAELEREFGPDDLFEDRIWLLREGGRGAEAFALVRAHPEAGTDHMLRLAASILDDLGRTEEAIALLRPHAALHFVGDDLAEMLLRRGEVDDAMAVVHGREPLQPWPDDPWAGVSTD
jgi:tetratricopeptide (TPR) repeat protein